MPCEVLGAGTAHRKQIRGSLYHVQDTPASWGIEEVKTPHYWIATISDAAATEVRPFLQRANPEDAFTGPRFIMTAAEVNNANEKSYTLAEFELFLVDQA